MGFENRASAPSQAKTENKPEPALSLNLEDNQKGGATEQEKYAALNGAKIAETLSGEKKELTHAEKVLEFRKVAQEILSAFQAYEKTIRAKYGDTKDGINKAKAELNEDAIKGVRGNMKTIVELASNNKVPENLGLIMQEIYRKSPKMHNVFDGIDISEFDDTSKKKTSYLGQGIRNNA